MRGKALCIFTTAKLVRDHPRLCGEKWKQFDRIRYNMGSPPPMRGKAGDAWVSGDALGITPAYAGKSR